MQESMGGCVKKNVYNKCIQWWRERQKRAAVRIAHKQWGHGRVAPYQLPLSKRFSLCRTNLPFNQPLMEEVYQEILNVCARPMEKTPWVWLPLNIVEEVEQHLSNALTYTDKKIRAMRACAQWMSTPNNLRHTINV